MIWYVRRGVREAGPLGEAALRALVGTGQITADTQLWREGLPGWTTALELPGVLGPRAAVAASPSQIEAPPFEPATPWRRYWARLIDLTVSMFLVAVVIGAIRPSLIAHLNAAVGARWVALLLLLPVALILDTLVYWLLGNTPGKAIAGIKVLTADGRRLLSAPKHLGRNFGVYVFGLGLGLPLIDLVTLIYAYRRAAAGDLSAWDRFSGSRVYTLTGNTLRTWLGAGLYVLAAAAVFALGLHTQHRKSTYAATHLPAPILEQELTQAANGVNATAPKMIDGITRLDGAHVGPGSLFTYEYTLTNMRVSDLSPAILATLRWRLSAHVRQAVCSGPALKPMLRTGTTIQFDYRDRDGRALVLVSVSSADCGI
jgi:uncharacterized RDD family membrane protein YckC